MPETLTEPPSLQDRVQALRLPDKVDHPGRSGGWLPWALCVLLAVTTVSLAARKNVAPRQPKLAVALLGGLYSIERAQIVLNLGQRFPQLGSLGFLLGVDFLGHLLKGFAERLADRFDH